MHTVFWKCVFLDARTHCRPTSLLRPYVCNLHAEPHVLIVFLHTHMKCSIEIYEILQLKEKVARSCVKGAHNAYICYFHAGNSYLNRRRSLTRLSCEIEEWGPPCTPEFGFEKISIRTVVKNLPYTHTEPYAYFFLTCRNLIMHFAITN